MIAVCTIGTGTLLFDLCCKDLSCCSPDPSQYLIFKRIELKMFQVTLAVLVTFCASASAFIGNNGSFIVFHFRKILVKNINNLSFVGTVNDKQTSVSIIRCCPIND